MTEWQQLLRRADLVQPLTADESEGIRLAMLAEAAAPSRVFPYERSLAGAVIGGLLAVAVSVGVLAARSFDAQVKNTEPVVSGEDLRHLQFATPGGTRIIWQFDPKFSLRETIP